MKKVKMAVALFAMAMAATILWAAPRPAQEFDQEAQEYKDYWFESVQKHKDEKMGRLLILDDIRYFCEQHPQCLLSKVDLATELLKMGNKKDGVEKIKEVRKIVTTVPETEEGKFAKAKYYRLSAEAAALGDAIGYRSGLVPANEANLCAKYNERLGAEAFYALGNFFAKKDETLRARSCFESAFKYDINFEQTTLGDIRLYYDCCVKGTLIQPIYIVSFFDKLYASKGFRYQKDLGSFSASVYEKGGNTDKAALAAILDKEYTNTYSETSAESLIEILKKHYKTANAIKCIEFIEKFYDKNQTMSEDDLKTLPEKVRNFLPVRYMYKMKTSDDIDALRNEFEPFFSTIGNFYKRLGKKAEKNGDKKAAEEIKKILAEKFSK